MKILHASFEGRCYLKIIGVNSVAKYVCQIGYLLSHVLYLFLIYIKYGIMLYDENTLWRVTIAQAKKYISL